MVHLKLSPSRLVKVLFYESKPLTSRFWNSRTFMILDLVNIDTLYKSRILTGMFIRSDEEVSLAVM